MKIIHCSDIHLNSKMESSLSSEKAKQRKQELLLTFSKMVDYARSENVKAVIIAGDLFDTESINKSTSEYVLDLIKSNEEIKFIYLCGNHEKSSFLNYINEVPQNLLTFNDEWKYYNIGENVVVAGIDITKSNFKTLYSNLKLDKNNTNIVVMHGQASKYFVEDNFEIVNLSMLKNKNINYLALGHIHSYFLDKLDDNSYYAYSGCLEGRGFDECGKKGFIELEVLNGQISSKFVPFAKREIVETDVDISNLYTIKEIDNKIAENVKGINPTSLIKVNLVGEIDEDANIDLPFLENNLNEIFYFAKIENKTKLKIDIEKYSNDVSIKGEFIRQVLASDLSDIEKEQVILYGIKALNGEVDLWKYYRYI